MEIFLWRHAEALPGANDFERELSPAGHRQARKVAEWFRQRAPEGLRLFVSPATRARQTVAYFHEDERDIQFCLPLYENRAPKEILSIIGWPDMEAPTLIVGHQPQIGDIARQLLSGASGVESFRPSALWWLRLDDGQNNCRLVQIVDGDTLNY